MPRLSSHAGGAKRRAPLKVDELVSTAVRERNRPMSAYDLVEHLASQGEKVAPQQVYRSLGRLCSEGAVRRIESLHAYCAGGEDGGAILYCERCGALRFPSVAHLADALREHAQSAGFSTSRAVIELCGLCEKCSFASSAWEEYQ